MNSVTRLGKRLKELRKREGLSQKQVALKFGYTSPQFVSNWERGLILPPKATMIALKEVIKISKHDFQECKELWKESKWETA